jgi:hypothetical protein
MFTLKKIRILLNGIISVLLFSTFSIYAQNENNPAPSGSPGESTTNTTDESIGYWELSGNNNGSNPTKITKWDGTGQSITGTSSWKDYLDIIHTVSSSFKWDAPPEKMIPGMEVNLKGIYTNNEYSTYGATKTGIKIFIEKVGDPISNPGYDAIDILKMTKDYKAHMSEVKNASYNPPKYFRGKSKDIQLVVDCYIGSDHYVTTYIYNWVSTQ